MTYGNQRRIFIAIPVSKKLEDYIKTYREKLDYLQVRWTPPENLHITLLFIGTVKEEKISGYLKKIAAKAADFNKFKLTFQKIILAPPELKIPRMIWMTPDSSGPAAQMTHAFGKALRVHSGRPSSHITIARIPARYQHQTMYYKGRIEQDCVLELQVKKIKVIESILYPDGPKYIEVDSYELG